MIVHEAVALDFYPELEGGITEHINVKCKAALLKEDAISSVAALRNVMGVIGDNDTR